MACFPEYFRNVAWHVPEMRNGREGVREMKTAAVELTSRSAVMMPRNVCLSTKRTRIQRFKAPYYPSLHHEEGIAHKLHGKGKG